MQFLSLFLARKMNFNMVSKKAFIKYDNVEKLYYELSNIVHLAANTCHIFYCYCKETSCFCFTKRKCTLCKFCSLFFTNNGIDNMSLEEFLIRNRNNEQNLLHLVDLFGPYFRKMRLFKPSALDFFKKEYVWSFRYYRNSIELSMNLQEEIDSTNKLIKLNGEEN